MLYLSVSKMRLQMNKCPYLCLFASKNTAYIPSSESDKTEEKKLFKGMISCEMQVTEHFVGFFVLATCDIGIRVILCTSV